MRVREHIVIYREQSTETECSVVSSTQTPGARVLERRHAAGLTSQQSLETLLETLPARARLARSVAAAMEVCCPARVPAGMPMRLSSSAATARAESGSEPH